MWRFIKWLVFLAILAAAFLAITGYKIGGKTIQEHFRPFTESKAVKEGVRDIRSLVGEGLKAAGEAISEDVTDEEREQLNNLVRQELKKGKPIEGTEGQVALPPKIRRSLQEHGITVREQTKTTTPTQKALPPQRRDEPAR